MLKNFFKTFGVTCMGLFFVIPTNVYANNYTCWDYVGKKFNLDPWLLLSIALTESSFQNGIKSKNSNGSYDLGLMQINTIHKNFFEKRGLSQYELQYDSCKNVIAAGVLLRQSINKYGYNIDGIGGYHSNTPKLRRAYGNKVIKNYNSLVNMYFVNKEPFSFERHREISRNKKYKRNNDLNIVQQVNYQPQYNYQTPRPVSYEYSGNSLVLTKTKQ